MKNKYLAGLLIGILSFTWLSCEDLADPLVEELQLSRPFTPTEVGARIRNMTTIELTWNVRDDADHYVVEFSEDDLQFASIIRTVTVTAEELPLQETFAGETRYSARVKAVNQEGVESKWASVTIETAQENIFMPLAPENVQETYATLNWPAGSAVTHFVISPGDTERTITAEEIAAGQATLEGLTIGTNYTVTIYNGAKRRGTVTFFTIRPANVSPDDDLVAVIAAAEDGAELVLEPGTYVTTGIITLSKSISIIGQLASNKPILNVAFDIAGGAGDVLLSDLELVGTGGLATTVNLATAGVDYGTVTISGCNIHDYARQLIYGNVASKLNAFTVDNCVIYNFTAGGGDFIDFRPTYVANVTVTNSTFYNAPSARDFIRIDAAASFTGMGLTSTVLVDHCTLYGLSNTQDRILYVRFVNNASTVKNTIIASTDAYYTNQPATSLPTFSNNNYFNAAGFTTEAYVTNAKHDNSGTHTTLDPGFADPATGNFTISNQTLIDNQIGDPRWRQ